MRNPSDSLVQDLQTALEQADDTEVKFHIRQALQHVETGRTHRERSRTD